MAGLILLTVFYWVSGLGLGYYKLRKYQPITAEMKARGAGLSDRAAGLIYNDPATLRARIKIIKELKYGPFKD